MTTTYDTVLQREEYLSPEEYLRRRAKGEIDPAKIRYAAHDPKTGQGGGFGVKLDKPAYKTDLQSPTSGYLQ